MHCIFNKFLCLKSREMSNELPPRLVPLEISETPCCMQTLWNPKFDWKSRFRHFRRKISPKSYCIFKNLLRLEFFTDLDSKGIKKAQFWGIFFMPRVLICTVVFYFAECFWSLLIFLILIAFWPQNLIFLWPRSLREISRS